MENSLPKGWSVIKLNDLCNLVYGKGLLTKELSENGYPVFGANGIIGHYSKYTYAEPKVIISCRGAASGAIHLTQPKSFVTSNSIVLDMITEEISNDYLKYAMLSIDRTQIVTGTAQPQITIENLKDLEVPLSPLDEQHRIVAKIDALLARVTNCKNRLEKIPALLKNFRQSVLAAAVSGEGKEEATGTVCDEIQIGPFGTQLHKHDYISNGIPLVNPTHIQSGKIVPDMDLTVSKTKYKELSNYYLEIGDVIMGRRGEMARCALVNEKENGWLCGTGSLFFRPNLKKVQPEYLYWTLSSQSTKTFLEGESKGTTMSNLNLTIVKNIPIILPSLKEQKEIVRKVEELFHFADSIEARYQKAKAWFDKLPQAILAKAFRGELVEQDENDEPATVLLERIKKEKQNTNKPKPTAKRKKVYEENEEVSLAAEE